MAVLIVVAVGLLSYLDDRASKRAEAATEQSRIIIDDTEELLLHLTDAETGERGYLLTGNPQYLAPYEAALPQIERLLGVLDRPGLVYADPEAKTLGVLAREKLQGLATSIEARRTGGTDAALEVVASNRVKGVMDRFRVVAARVISAESAQFTARSAAAAIHDKRSRRSVLLGAVVLAFLIIISARHVDRLFREIRTQTAELEQSEQRFRMTFDRAAVGIANVAPDGRWLRVNRKLCDIMGYSREELLQRTFQDLTYPEDLEADLDKANRVLAGEMETYSIEKRYIHKTGSVVWAHLTVALANGRPVEPTYFISVVEDITERKSLEEQVRQTQKMDAIGRLAGGVAHDFNNLLTVIGGYGQMVLSEIPENDSMRYRVEAICRSADRASALTSQLLAFSRRQMVQPRILNLNEQIAGIRDMLHHLLGAAISLNVMPSSLPVKVKIDPAQLEQLMMNLVANARDAMPCGGELTIEVENSEIGHEVVIRVRDTGIGMDPDVQSHLFEPFFTTKERGKGTGLGLSIVYGIVKQAGGSIAVKSRPGEGTEFQIVLPRVLNDEADVQVGTPVQEISPGAGSVLLVEDDDALRKMAGEMLRSIGYNVHEAASGEEALAVCSQSRTPIPLLVTDMIMPGMNGRTLAERLRHSQPTLKVLYISGYTENILDLHGPLGNGTAFLQKPFTVAALATHVRELLKTPA